MVSLDASASMSSPERRRSFVNTVLTEPFRPRTWRETFYNALAFPMGLLWFVMFIVLLTLSVGLIPLALVGLVLLFITLLLAQGAAVVERELGRGLLGVDAGTPARRRPPTPGIVTMFWSRLIDPVTWKELIYLFLRFPLGIASFVATVALWSTAGAGITAPFWAWAVVRANSDDSSMLWVRGSGVEAWELVATVATGLVALLLAPWVMRAFALLYEAMVRILLGRSREQELEHEVERLSDSRARSVDVAATERVRIERNLHDGAQARLVSLAVDLGRARERLEREDQSGEAAQLVADAHEEAKLALSELRDLARGIHPTVLTDRGLDAALSSLAARCPVPVILSVDLPERPPPRVEAVAYFVLAELLTNVARHSQATSTNVSVAEEDDRLVLRVEDNGVGGADPTLGTGLAGLRDRVQTLDGTLEVTSPAGGPTVVQADVPLAP